LRILVVDDAAFVRAKIGRLLSANGYVIEEAENGAEAVSKYQSYRPDIVLMDITMPIMDGISAVRELRRLDPGVKVVMCTALGQRAMVLEAIKAGARDFIVKPFDNERVLEAIERLCSNG
jgi:two-component system chemotaxis response regulator CheY